MSPDVLRDQGKPGLMSFWTDARLTETNSIILQDAGGNIPKEPGKMSLRSNSAKIVILIFLMSWTEVPLTVDSYK